MPLAIEGTPVHANATNVTSLTMPAFSTTQAAQLFINVLSNNNPINAISGGGLTWTRRTQGASASPNYISLWTAQSTGSLSSQVMTLTLLDNTGFITADLFAFSGQDTSTIWDANASVPAFSNSGPDPILISTSNANDVIIAGFRMSSQASPTAGSGFTQIGGSDYLLTEYQIVSATQTNLSCGITTGSGDSNGCVADAMMAAAGGGGSFGNGLLISTARNRLVYQ